MLVNQNYTFHRHSTNPKSGRINWRCSRRRVKEIRCPSSCHTINGIVSTAAPHDPKCLPLSEAALESYKHKTLCSSSHLPIAFNSTKANRNQSLNVKQDSMVSMDDKNTLNSSNEQSHDLNSNNNNNSSSCGSNQFGIKQQHLKRGQLILFI
jgi:hypothetical protein